MLAETAAGARDDGDLAGKIEEVVAGCGVWHLLARRSRLGAFSWSENNLQQARFTGVETVEPRGTVFEGGDLRDQRLHLDGAGRKKFNGLRIFAGGGTGTLQSDLTTDHLLQMDFYFGGEVADECNGAAFADGVNAVGDGLGAADGFEDGVDAVAVGELENLLCEVGFRVEDFRGAEIFRHLEARGVNVGNEDLFCAGGAKRLEDEQADHAGADDEGRRVFFEWSETDGV